MGLTTGSLKAAIQDAKQQATGPDNIQSLVDKIEHEKLDVDGSIMTEAKSMLLTMKVKAAVENAKQQATSR